MPILRVTAQWTGFTGGPGYSNFHFGGFESPEAALPSFNAARAFCVALLPLMPSGTTVSLDPEVAVIDTTSGQVEDYVSTTPASTGASGGTTAPYAGPTGAVVNWLTNGVRNGRRVRGRTFVVPLSSAAFDSQGTLTSSVLTTIRTAATALVDSSTAPDFGVYSRPVNGAGGAFYAATAARVPDLAAVLRSRRD